ncbi:unnamed protein product [Paramecium pentaurelia]|uniref:Uncharacterized protein n=1 Tax=Paramecium pentaurelia TaxID=43138 RepID=A0A8S1W964_9CILI|nr:unnamed protein product [Paramecium pentaurelia]
MAQIQIQQDQKQSIHNTLRQPYQKIGNEIREKVIYDIVFQENSIKQTALKYGLKYSTANGIVQTFQQQGRCMKKDKRNKKQYFKRIKILVIIDIQTGDVNLYQQQTTSNVLILESSTKSPNIINFKQQDQFHHPQECTKQFIHQDIESISNNLIFWMKKKMKFGNCKNDVSSNNFKNHKNMNKSKAILTQQDGKQQIQIKNELKNTEIQNKLISENINHQKQESTKQKEENINQQLSDQLKAQILETQGNEQAIFNLEKKNQIQQQLDNILKLWKQQIFIMSQK